MKKLIFLGLMVLSLNGCVGLAVDSLEEKIRLKWAEEWKPALTQEMKDAISEGKEVALEQMAHQVDKYRLESSAKLEAIGVKVEQFDTNQDGQVAGPEMVAMLKDIKDKNDKAPKPLTWWEILMAVVAAYVPATGLKEVARKKLETKPVNA